MRTPPRYFFARELRRIGADSRTRIDLAADGLRLAAVKAEDSIHAPSAQQKVLRPVHAAQELLAAAEWQLVGSARHKRSG